MPPFDGNGKFDLPVTTVTPAVSTTTIDSADFNTFTADIETALTLCITKDGQTSSPLLTTPQVNEAVNVTSTSTELNLLDGATVTTAEINILDGVTSTAAELNVVDGDTAATSTTVVDANRLILNDNGTMVQVAVTDLNTYFTGGLNSKIIDIGDWDMHNVTGTHIATLAHGLNYTKIRTVMALIRDDNDQFYFDFGAKDSTETSNSYIRVDATNIILVRANGGSFDQILYNDGTSFNRGWITIQYIV